MQLNNKVAVITGAAKGIGEATARYCAKHGAQLVLADIDVCTGQGVSDSINANGGKSLFCPCDVGCERDVRAVLDAAIDRYARIDVLVNNAAVQLNKSFFETTPTEFGDVLNTNLTSMFTFMQGAAVIMKEQPQGGAIVNVCSSFAVVGSPGYIAYHASKGGVAALTRAAAVALMPYNIRVNAVGPGTVDTPGLRRGAKDTGDESAGMERFLSLQPLKRFGKPEEIAPVIAFLASNEASFVTGALWMADGGYTII